MTEWKGLERPRTYRVCSRWKTPHCLPLGRGWVHVTKLWTLFEIDKWARAQAHSTTRGVWAWPTACVCPSLLRESLLVQVPTLLHTTIHSEQTEPISGLCIPTGPRSSGNRIALGAIKKCPCSLACHRQPSCDYEENKLVDEASRQQETGRKTLGSWWHHWAHPVSELSVV